LVVLLLYLTRKESIDYFHNATDGYQAACDELTRKRTFLYMYLNYLKAPVQDLSNTLINVFMGKDESMSFQNDLARKCTANMTEDCRLLASVDAGIFKVLPDIDIFYNNLLYGQPDLNNLLQKLNNYASALGCNAAAIDGKGIINPMDLSNNNLNMDKDIGVVDTQTAALELEKLSPYYLSPDVVRFLLRFLISQEQLGHLHDTSKEYLKTQTRLVPKILHYFPPSTGTMKPLKPVVSGKVEKGTIVFTISTPNYGTPPQYLFLQSDDISWTTNIPAVPSQNSYYSKLHLDLLYNSLTNYSDYNDGYGETMTYTLPESLKDFLVSGHTYKFDFSSYTTVGTSDLNKESEKTRVEVTMP